MKYIEKDYNTEIVKEHKQDLMKQELDKKSLLQKKTEGKKLSSRELYVQVRKKKYSSSFL